MQKRLEQFLHRYNTIFIVMISIDMVVVGLHLLFSHNVSFFHMDVEQNLPTYYQSLKLIIFGSLFMLASILCKHTRVTRAFMMPLALFLLMLGLDELLQIHENIYRIFEIFEWLHPSKIVDVSMKMGYRSSLWILYYVPAIFLFVFWSGYWLKHFQTKLSSNAKIISLSSVSFFIILLTEILSSTGAYSDSAYFTLVTIEEAAEMVLSTALIFVGNKMLTTKIS